MPDPIQFESLRRSLQRFLKLDCLNIEGLWFPLVKAEILKAKFKKLKPLKLAVERLSIEREFSQLRPFLDREGIKTVSSDVSMGVIKAENPAAAFQRALPIDIFASQDDNLLTVEMIFTLPSGVGASRDTVKKYLCDALNQLLPKSQ